MILEPQVPADILSAVRAPFADAGAVSVEAPVIQPLGLLLDLAGEAMRARLFVVQGEGGEDSEPSFPIYVGEGRDSDPELDPYSLGLRQTYLNHRRFRGAAGKSRPQIDDLGDARGFKARGPPVIGM